MKRTVKRTTKSKPRRTRKSPARKPRKLSPPKPRTAYVLRPGDLFRLHPDCVCAANDPAQVFEVIRVNQGSAACRALSRIHTTVTSPGGDVIADFWKSGRTFHISPTASVILLPGDARRCG